MPISFVIIGIGEDENKFQKIKKLCEINKGKNGVKKYRNNTFFITMKECEYSSEIIKNKCLQKIPEQLCEFYESNKISLEEIKKNNLNDKNSLRIFETYNSLISQMNFGDKENDKNKNIINNVEPSFNEIKMNNNDKEMNIGNKEFNNEITPDGENNIDINIDINKNRNIDINIDVNKNIKNNSLKKKNPNKNQKKYKIKGSFINESLGKNINENPYNE